MKQIKSLRKKNIFKCIGLLVSLLLICLSGNIQAQNCDGITSTSISALNNPTVCKDSSISVMFNVAVQPGASYQWIKDPSWQNVGTPNFSAGDAAYTSIAVDSSGTPYVLYSDDANGGKATVMKYDGTNWVAVGTPGFSSDFAYYTSLAISDSNIVYAAFFDAGNGSAATVMKFNGTNWVNVGSPGFTSSSANGTRIVIDHNETPYVVYTDYNDTLNVMKFDGSNWNIVGSGGISQGKTYAPSIAIAPDNTPYVAYSDDAGSFKPVVKMFDGINWVLVGAPAFAADSADDVDIAISDSGKVYITYGNYQDNFRTNVWEFDGTTWTQLGQPNFSALTEDWLTIELDGSGTPYIAYQDGAYGQKLTVKKFDGTNWVDLGSHGFSPDLVYYSTMAFDRNGIPYVTFNDYGNGGKATVMKFDGTLVGSNDNFTATDTGCYSVRVITCKGAYSLNTICVEMSDLEVMLTGQTDVSCFGGMDGEAIIEPMGGAGPFSFIWSLGGAPIQFNDTASGLTMNTYIATVVDSNLCPASITVNIIEPAPVDTSVTVSGVTLTANSASATYKWIDCNSNTPIPGEVNSSFTPITNGSYAVIVTENGACVDTSGCHSITVMGIGDPQKQNAIVIYPNPSNGVFIIKASSGGIYKLINELGEVVKELSLDDADTVTINDLRSGVYFLTLQTQNTFIKQKIVVIKN